MATTKKAAKKDPAEISALAAGGAVPLEAVATAHPAKLTEAEAVIFDFAVNVVKLNRAKMWVNQQAALEGKPAPTGAALVAAVKDRYKAMGGLVRGEEAVRTPKRGGRVVNVAPHDGSKD